MSPILLVFVLGLLGSYGQESSQVTDVGLGIQPLEGVHSTPGSVDRATDGQNLTFEVTTLKPRGSENSTSGARPRHRPIFRLPFRRGLLNVNLHETIDKSNGTEELKNETSPSTSKRSVEVVTDFRSDPSIQERRKRQPYEPTSSEERSAKGPPPDRRKKRAISKDIVGPVPIFPKDSAKCDQVKGYTFIDLEEVFGPEPGGYEYEGPPAFSCGYAFLHGPSLFSAGLPTTIEELKQKRLTVDEILTFKEKYPLILTHCKDIIKTAPKKEEAKDGDVKKHRPDNILVPLIRENGTTVVRVGSIELNSEALNKYGLWKEAFKWEADGISDRKVEDLKKRHPEVFDPKYGIDNNAPVPAEEEQGKEIEKIEKPINIEPIHIDRKRSPFSITNVASGEDLHSFRKKRQTPAEVAEILAANAAEKEAEKEGDTFNEYYDETPVAAANGATVGRNSTDYSDFYVSEANNTKDYDANYDATNGTVADYDSASKNATEDDQKIVRAKRSIPKTQKIRGSGYENVDMEIYGSYKAPRLIEPKPRYHNPTYEQPGNFRDNVARFPGPLDRPGPPEGSQEIVDRDGLERFPIVHEDTSQESSERSTENLGEGWEAAPKFLGSSEESSSEAKGPIAWIGGNKGKEIDVCRMIEKKICLNGECKMIKVCAKDGSDRKKRDYHPSRTMPSPDFVKTVDFTSKFEGFPPEVRQQFKDFHQKVQRQHEQLKRNGQGHPQQVQEEFHKQLSNFGNNYQRNPQFLTYPGNMERFPIVRDDDLIKVDPAISPVHPKIPPGTILRCPKAGEPGPKCDDLEEIIEAAKNVPNPNYRTECGPNDPPCQNLDEIVEYLADRFPLGLDTNFNVPVYRSLPAVLPLRDPPVRLSFMCQPGDPLCQTIPEVIETRPPFLRRQKRRSPPRPIARPYIEPQLLGPRQPPKPLSRPYIEPLVQRSYEDRGLVRLPTVKDDGPKPIVRSLPYPTIPEPSKGPPIEYHGNPFTQPSVGFKYDDDEDSDESKPRAGYGRDLTETEKERLYTFPVSGTFDKDGYPLDDYTAKKQGAPINNDVIPRLPQGAKIPLINPADGIAQQDPSSDAILPPVIFVTPPPNGRKRRLATMEPITGKVPNVPEEDVAPITTTSEPKQESGGARKKRNYVPYYPNLYEPQVEQKTVIHEVKTFDLPLRQPYRPPSYRLPQVQQPKGPTAPQIHPVRDEYAKPDSYKPQILPIRPYPAKLAIGATTRRPITSGPYQPDPIKNTFYRIGTIQNFKKHPLEPTINRFLHGVIPQKRPQKEQGHAGPVVYFDPKYPDQPKAYYPKPRLGTVRKPATKGQGLAGPVVYFDTKEGKSKAVYQNGHVEKKRDVEVQEQARRKRGGVYDNIDEARTKRDDNHQTP